MLLFRFGFSVALAAAWCASAHAATYTTSSYTYDTANAPTTGVILGTGVTIAPGITGTATTAVGNGTITAWPALNAPTTDSALSTGRLLGGTGTSNRRVTFDGIGSVREGAEFRFANNMFLPNGAGDDLVIFEDGDPGQPEPFAVAVRIAGSSTFSAYRYEIYDNQSTSYGARRALATGFDLSDFGLVNGAWIDAIRVVNLAETDRLNTPTSGGFGVGVVTFNATAPTSGLRADPRGPGLDTAVFTSGFPSSEFDPDIVFVGGLQTLAPIPEPHEYLMLVLGLGLIGRLVKRRI
jgi:hypothetical protein